MARDDLVWAEVYEFASDEFLCRVRLNYTPRVGDRIILNPLPEEERAKEPWRWVSDLEWRNYNAGVCLRLYVSDVMNKEAKD